MATTTRARAGEIARVAEGLLTAKAPNLFEGFAVLALYPPEATLDATVLAQHPPPALGIHDCAALIDAALRRFGGSDLLLRVCGADFAVATLRERTAYAVSSSSDSRSRWLLLATLESGRVLLVMLSRADLPLEPLSLAFEAAIAKLP